MLEPPPEVRDQSAIAAERVVERPVGVELQHEPLRAGRAVPLTHHHDLPVGDRDVERLVVGTQVQPEPPFPLKEPSSAPPGRSRATATSWLAPIVEPASRIRPWPSTATARAVAPPVNTVWKPFPENE